MNSENFYNVYKEKIFTIEIEGGLQKYCISRTSQTYN